MNTQMAVLGGCLMSDEVLDIVMSISTPEDFTDINRSVFDAMLKVTASGKKATLSTMKTYFDDHKYLLDLMDCFITTHTIRHDCYELREIRQKQEVQKELDSLSTQIPKIALRDTLNKIRTMIRKVDIYDPDVIRDLDRDPYRGLTELKGNYISTGLNTIDQALNDLAPGCVTLITGRANSGKSTLINQIIANAIGAKNKVLLITGEGIQELIINNLYRLIIGRDESLYEMKLINKKYFMEPKEDVLKRLAKWHHKKLAIFNKTDSKLKTTEELFALVGDEVSRKEHNLIVIDNLMSILSVEKATEKLERQSDFMQKCCDLAKEKMVHIILVVHPNKQVEKGSRMDFDQISGTQDLSNKADNIISVTRYYDACNLNQGISGEIEVLKNRYFPELPTIKTYYDTKSGILAEIDERTQQPKFRRIVLEEK